MPDKDRTKDRKARDPVDPKGLIRESFRIDGITLDECRSIFVDWALSTGAEDTGDLIRTLLDRYAEMPRDHPMMTLLIEGVGSPVAARRRGGRAGRLGKT